MSAKGSRERRAITRKARRLQKARKQPAGNPWLGFGMFGMVGWSIAVPTLAGTALGLFIDARVAGDRSWTLALLLAGAALGCLNAWYWVQREGKGDD
jgi:ATP synthase protein I